MTPSQHATPASSPSDEGVPLPTARQALRWAIDRHRTTPLVESLASRDLGAYRGYGEILQLIEQFAEDGATLEVIGESVEGEPLFSIAHGSRNAPVTTALISGIHPMEWIGIETHLALLQRFADAAPVERRIVSVVVANPDGMIRVERNLRHRKRRLIRHNRRGVDLNRNFPGHWGRLNVPGLVLRRLLHPGKRPASEPEVQALIDCFRDSCIDRAVSFHSMGGAVLYPYAALFREPADVALHRRWARSIAERADRLRPYRAVQCARWAPGLTAPGTELDWLHDHHGAISLLLECSRAGLDALRGGHVRKLLEPFTWYNPPRREAVAGEIAAAVEAFARGASSPPAHS